MQRFPLTSLAVPDIQERTHSQGSMFFDWRTSQPQRFPEKLSTPKVLFRVDFLLVFSELWQEKMKLA